MNPATANVPLLGGNVPNLGAKKYDVALHLSDSSVITLREVPEEAAAHMIQTTASGEGVITGPHGRDGITIPARAVLYARLLNVIEID